MTLTFWYGNKAAYSFHSNLNVLAEIYCCSPDEKINVKYIYQL